MPRAPASPAGGVSFDDVVGWRSIGVGVYKLLWCRIGVLGAETTGADDVAPGVVTVFVEVSGGGPAVGAWAVDWGDFGFVGRQFVGLVFGPAAEGGVCGDPVVDAGVDVFFGVFELVEQGPRAMPGAGGYAFRRSGDVLERLV